jgi:hypothetical protein
MDLVLVAKAIEDIVFMLPNAPNQIAGHADIERTVGTVGQQINARLLHGPANLMDCVAHVTWVWIATLRSQ